MADLDNKRATWKKELREEIYNKARSFLQDDPMRHAFVLEVLASEWEAQQTELGSLGIPITTVHPKDGWFADQYAQYADRVTFPVKIAIPNPTKPEQVVIIESSAAAMQQSFAEKTRIKAISHIVSFLRQGGQPETDEDFIKRRGERIKLIKNGRFPTEVDLQPIFTEQIVSVWIDRRQDGFSNKEKDIITIGLTRLGKKQCYRVTINCKKFQWHFNIFEENQLVWSMLAKRHSLLDYDQTSDQGSIRRYERVNLETSQEEDDNNFYHQYPFLEFIQAMINVYELAELNIKSMHLYCALTFVAKTEGSTSWRNFKYLSVQEQNTVLRAEETRISMEKNEHFITTVCKIPLEENPAGTNPEKTQRNANRRINFSLATMHLLSELINTCPRILEYINSQMGDIYSEDGKIKGEGEFLDIEEFPTYVEWITEQHRLDIAIYQLEAASVAEQATAPGSPEQLATVIRGTGLSRPRRGFRQIVGADIPSDTAFRQIRKPIRRWSWSASWKDILPS